MGDGGPEVFPTSSNVVVHDGRHGEATTPSSSSPSTSDPTPPWTDGGAFNDSWAAGCRLGSPFDDPAGLNPVTLSICTLYLFFGVFGAFFGYRCFKATMFLTGFVFASIIVYLICLESQQEAGLPLWAAALIALSAGLLFGLITLLVQYVGLFILGFHGGLLMGLAGLVVAADLGRRVAGAEHGDPAEVAGVDHHDWTHSPWVSVGCLLASGLTLALCNLYFQVSFCENKTENFDLRPDEHLRDSQAYFRQIFCIHILHSNLKTCRSPSPSSAPPSMGARWWPRGWTTWWRTRPCCSGSGTRSE